MNTRKLVAAAGIAGALIFTSACSAPQAASTPTASDAASAAATPSATPSPTKTAVQQTLSNGLVAKGLANDGKGDYLQTSIADSDPAMKYNPSITDDAAKEHYSEADLAEAQKVIVKFIAEEIIDSSLNGGAGSIDAWWAGHKDQIHPLNWEPMMNDFKNGKGALDQEPWMAEQPDLAYVHGATTSRLNSRTITPVKFRYVTSSDLQGVMLDTTASWEMGVTFTNGSKVQPTTAEISIAVAKDDADGKWKIAGYNTNFHTTEYKIGG